MAATTETPIQEWTKVVYAGSLEAYHGLVFSATFCYCENVRCPGYNIWRDHGEALVDLHHVRRESIRPV